ncbi:MAG TPA: hypothetical protein VD816_14570 [Ohtaekwangia sp.]|nr:hypothetical protein [Ohtaekwangia sp.]
MLRYGTLLFPCWLIFAAFSCQTAERSRIDPALVPPLILTTAISDSLPPKAVSALGLHNVTGVKIKYITGQYAQYFEYEADRAAVLQMLALLPFSRYTEKADTVARRIGHAEFEKLRREIPSVELENSTSFWSADEAYDVYECLKFPLIHTVLISKDSNRIIHRIARMG